MLDLEDKFYITLIYEDKDSRVSWFSDTDVEDVKFAIKCACDSLVDGEFELLDCKAKVLNIDKVNYFENGSVYFLKKKQGSQPTNILVDGTRKLYVQIEALKHIESQIAIKNMLVGSNLLKHTKNNHPHIRFFQLSMDLKRILWFTKSKSLDESHVAIENIVSVMIGQKSENFIKYPLKMLENYSFSIIYLKSDDSKEYYLDLTCKDEREFDLWVIGIKALYSHFRNRLISKNELLDHSRSYQEQVRKGNIGSCSKFLCYDNKNKRNDSVKTAGDMGNDDTIDSKKTLEDFIVARNLHDLGIANLFLKLANRLKSMKKDVEIILNQDSYTTGNKVEGYESLFAEEAIVDDIESQKNQMHKLFDQCEENLIHNLQRFLKYEQIKNKTHSNNNNNNNSGYNDYIEDHDALAFVLNELKLYLETQQTTDLDNDISVDDDIIPKMNSNTFLKDLDIKLWRIEIDVENIGDIINRFSKKNDIGFISKLKNLFKFN